MAVFSLQRRVNAAPGGDFFNAAVHCVGITRLASLVVILNRRYEVSRLWQDAGIE